MSSHRQRSQFDYAQLGARELVATAFSVSASPILELSTKTCAASCPSVARAAVIFILGRFPAGRTARICGYCICRGATMPRGGRRGRSAFWSPRSSAATCITGVKPVCEAASARSQNVATVRGVTLVLTAMRHGGKQQVTPCIIMPATPELNPTSNEMLANAASHGIAPQTKRMLRYTQALTRSSRSKKWMDSTTSRYVGGCCRSDAREKITPVPATVALASAAVADASTRPVSLEAIATALAATAEELLAASPLTSIDKPDVVSGGEAAPSCA